MQNETKIIIIIIIYRILQEIFLNIISTKPVPNCRYNLHRHTLNLCILQLVNVRNIPKVCTKWHA
jgi:hypothetical protein